MDKIVFFEVEPWEEAYMQKALPEVNGIYRTDKLTESNVAEVSDTTILSTFIYSKINRQILGKLPRLCCIATRSTGFDHIDIEFCKKNRISVCNVPTYGVNTIGEHTFALILAISRKLVPSIEQTRRGDFSLDNLRGSELAGKTLGILGFGHIGKRVAEIAVGFRMKILVSTRHPDTSENYKYVQFVDLPTLLGKSDIVSVHVPLNTETKHLINKDNITLMRQNSILINTARGAVIETEAILWALEKRMLAGVGLDVLEEECVLKEERELLTKEFLKTCNLKTQLLNHVLLTRDDVIITPHNAFNSQEALIQILDTTVTNITAWMNGKAQNKLL